MNPKRIIINPHHVLADLAAGVDDEGLMVKYNLNYRQLQRLYRKMITAGYITSQELAQRLCITKSQVSEAMDQVRAALKELD